MKADVQMLFITVKSKGLLSSVEYTGFANGFLFMKMSIDEVREWVKLTWGVEQIAVTVPFRLRGQKVTLAEALDRIVIGTALDGVELAERQDFFVINVTEKVENPKADYFYAIGIPRTADEPIKISTRELDDITKQIHNVMTATFRKYVLVHCTAGLERSPLVVTWYLHKYFGLSLQDAFWKVKECLRPEAENRISWISYRTLEEFLEHNQ